MKQFIVGFGKFVNEMYNQGEGLDKTSNCCNASILEDGTCSECGAFEITEDNPEDFEPQFNNEMPEEADDALVDDLEDDQFEEPYDELELDLGDLEEIEPEHYRRHSGVYEKRKNK